MTSNLQTQVLSAGAPQLEDRESSPKLRILFFAQQQVWPINSGARMRNYYMAREMAACASLTFVEMGSEGTEMVAPPAEAGFEGVVSLRKGSAYTPMNVLRGLAGPTPVTVLNCWSKESASKLAELLGSQQFDTAQIEGVHLLEYLPIIQQNMDCSKIVVDWHNIESELMWRYASTTENSLKKVVARRTARLIENAEDRLLDAFSTHLVASERERQKLLARHPGAFVHVVPNGVDAAGFREAGSTGTQRDSQKAGPKPTILFVGSMDYHANADAVTWFAMTAWPEIARKHPELDFMIVGREPLPEVRSLASDRIHVTGTVDDVRPYYASAAAVVVPLRCGSGTRLKILEAMAAGVPVVSTSLGIEGIDAEHGVHYLRADRENEIVSALSHLVSSIGTRIRLSAAGKSLVLSKYDWPIIGKQLYQIHRGIAHQESVTPQFCS